MEPGTWTLSPWQLRTQLQPAYGGHWDEAVAILLGDPYEAQVIRDLCTHLEGGGSFDEPIRIDASRICNGMHRSVASLITATSIRASEYSPRQVHPYWEVRFVAEVPEDVRTSHPEYDDAVQHGWMSVHSFPTQDGWLEAVSLSSTSGVISATYEWDGDGETLARHVTAAALRFGITIEVLSVEIDEDEDEDQSQE